tara:strand:+ start:131 stop:502 length:372 start_codon:yes stop_codon:yes gene_type:complete
MVLNITEKEAELIYRMLGGKRLGNAESDLGDSVLGETSSKVPGGVFMPGSGILEEDLETRDSLMTKVVEKRKNADRRVLEKLDKIIEELEGSGFSEDHVNSLNKIKTDASAHNEKKYVVFKNK